LFAITNAAALRRSAARARLPTRQKRKRGAARRVMYKILGDIE
jgi:hypothetical protein